MNKKTIRDISVVGKKVFVRVDYNVPMDKSGAITDDTRIRATIPTLSYLLEQGAAIIVAAHLGRPKGTAMPEFSLAPVGKKLAELLDRAVLVAPDCIGPVVKKMAGELQAGQVLLLENLRFHKEEEKNDASFSAE